MPARSSRLHKDLQAIGKAFKTLAHHFERIAPQLGEHADVVMTGSPNGIGARRKPRMTAATRAAMQLQGKYMGTMSRLSTAKRTMVKKIRAEKGIEAAITAAKKMAPSAPTVAARSGSNNDARRPRRKRQFTVQQRASMKLHGRYIGSIRRLKPRQRAQVKAIRVAKGTRAAIAAAMKMAG